MRGEPVSLVLYAVHTVSQECKHRINIHHSCTSMHYLAEDMQWDAACYA